MGCHRDLRILSTSPLSSNAVDCFPARFITIGPSFGEKDLVGASNLRSRQSAIEERRADNKRRNRHLADRAKIFQRRRILLSVFFFVAAHRYEFGCQITAERIGLVSFHTDTHGMM